MRVLAAFLLSITLATPVAAVAPGTPAPGISATTLIGGTSIELSSYRGKVVYLDFWASWCAPCGASLPWMEEMRKEFGERGFEVLAVNVDEDPADGRRFLKRFSLTYPVLEDRHGVIAEAYDVKEMPSSYLIDHEGIVRKVHRGFNSRDAVTLRKAVIELLDEPAK